MKHFRAKFAPGSRHVAKVARVVFRASATTLIGLARGAKHAPPLRDGFRFKRLLIVGAREEIEAGGYRSAVTPRAVLATLSAIEARFEIPVCFAPTPAAASLQIESWAYWFARELVEAANDLARAPGLTRHPSANLPETATISKTLPK